MSTSSSDKIDIVVGNFKADAMLVNVGGTRTLFMRQRQTFSTAVRHVRNVVPGITLEAAERMVREQCPEFRDLDDMLGLNTPTLPSVERPLAEPTEEADKEDPRRKRRRRAALVAALLPALAASWALGRYTDTAGPTAEESSTSAPDVTVDTAGSESAESAAPFDDSQFQFFAGSSKIECNPISVLEAECTDADGMVMSTKAATGPDSTIFTFSYGSERIGLRIFYDADYADTWARQDGSRELYPGMKMHGRFVLWGTDSKRIAEYMKLLVDADRAVGPTAMGGAAPLPPRLAALTLGTLGLDQSDVGRIIARPAVATTDAPAMVAARLVLGLDTTPVPSAPGGEDIVALAAGIEPSPPASATPDVVIVPTRPSTGTAPAAPVESSAPAPTAPTTAPSTTPKAPEGPATTTPAPSEPEHTPPAPSAPPATADPAPEQSQAPAPEKPATADPAPEQSQAPAPEKPATADPAPEQSQAPAPEKPASPAPTQPESPAPPVEETPAPADPPPAQEAPAPPTEDEPGVPPAAGPPADEVPPPVPDTAAPGEPPAAGQDGPEGNLVILDSAWTTAV